VSHGIPRLCACRRGNRRRVGSLSVVRFQTRRLCACIVEPHYWSPMNLRIIYNCYIFLIYCKYVQFTQLLTSFQRSLVNLRGQQLQNEPRPVYLARTQSRRWPSPRLTSCGKGFFLILDYPATFSPWAAAGESVNTI